MGGGGVQNVGVQVVKTNVEQSSKIKRSFIEVTKRLRTYFTRVNHAYFYPPETNVHEISDILNDDAISTFINTMIFDVGVQSYSNINRIINFHIDMTQQNHNNKVKPDKLLLDEVNKKHLQTNNDDETSSTEAAMNLQPVALPDAECNELRNVVAGLLELQLTGDSHEVMTRKNIDTNMSTDNMEVLIMMMNRTLVLWRNNILMTAVSVVIVLENLLTIQMMKQVIQRLTRSWRINFIV